MTEKELDEIKKKAIDKLNIQCDIIDAKYSKKAP